MARGGDGEIPLEGESYSPDDLSCTDYDNNQPMFAPQSNINSTHAFVLLKLRVRGSFPVSSTALLRPPPSVSLVPHRVCSFVRLIHRNLRLRVHRLTLH